MSEEIINWGPRMTAAQAGVELGVDGSTISSAAIAQMNHDGVAPAVRAHARCLFELRGRRIERTPRTALMAEEFPRVRTLYRIEVDQAVEAVRVPAPEAPATKIAHAVQAHGLGALLRRPTVAAREATAKDLTRVLVNKACVAYQAEHRATFNELYTAFAIFEGIDLKMRCRNAETKGERYDSVLDYAEQHGHDEALYARAWSMWGSLWS